MTDSANYLKIVEWSEEDQVFVGQCPGIVGPCCHGDDEVEVYRELCEIVEDCIEILQRDDGTLPPPTASTAMAEKIVEMNLTRYQEARPR